MNNSMDDSERHLSYYKKQNTNAYNSGAASNLRFGATDASIFPKFGTPSFGKIEEINQHLNNLAPIVNELSPNKPLLIMNGGMRRHNSAS